MKFSKRFRWAIVVVVLFVFSASFLMWNTSVGATFSNVHAFIVIARLETEIMQKTPAGQYYESLFWKHNDELMRIMQDHPERKESFWRVTRLFIPELEALVMGTAIKHIFLSNILKV